MGIQTVTPVKRRKGRAENRKEPAPPQPGSQQDGSIPKVRTEVEPEGEDSMEGVRRVDWTVDSFYRAIEAGMFECPQRLELIQGEVIEKLSPQQPPHASSILRAARETQRAFGDHGHVRTQMPLDISKPTEPEPDVAVVRGQLEDFDEHQPTASDVLLIIEVSDTTLGYDRNCKAAVYAEAGIGDYWVLALNGRWMEVRRDPAPMPDSPHGWGYKSVVRYTEGESVAPLHAPHHPICVTDLLPRHASQD